MWSSCVISWDGKVVPCCYDKDAQHVLGDVNDQPFREIWESSELFRELRDFGSYRGKCGECEYLNVCGGCRARADAVHGHYLEEEPFCGYVPLKVRRRAEAEVRGSLASSVSKEE